jgi:hypothetical protein
LAVYIERDQPEILVVDNMDAEYVSKAVDQIDLSGYERHDFFGNPADKEGNVSADCTTVWLRKPSAASGTESSG